MNKTLKKLISIVLVLTLSLTAFGGVFSAFAEGTTAASVSDDSEEEYSKTTFLELFVRFWKSIGDFFKYVFYELLLGKPAPDIPEKPSYRFF